MNMVKNSWSRRKVNFKLISKLDFGEFALSLLDVPGLCVLSSSFKSFSFRGVSRNSMQFPLGVVLFRTLSYELDEEAGICQPGICEHTYCFDGLDS